MMKRSKLHELSFEQRSALGINEEARTKQIKIDIVGDK